MKDTRVGAYGIVVLENKILLCRLSKIVVHAAGKWTLPGGGIDFGEEPIDAVAREIKEETGLTAISASLRDVQSSVVQMSDDKEVHAIRIIYKVHVEPGDLVVEKGGSSDACAWFTQKEAALLPKINLAEHALKLIGWT